VKKVNSASLKKEAEALWLQGNSVEKVAEVLGINKNTVQTWGFRYNWIEKKVQLYEQTKKTLYAKLIDQVTQSAQRYLQGSLLLGHLSLMALNEIHEDVKNGERSLEECKGSILVWANVLAKGSSIHRNVVPDANEQVTQQILEELKRMNDIIIPKEFLSVPAITEEKKKNAASE